VNPRPVNPLKHNKYSLVYSPAGSSDAGHSGSIVQPHFRAHQSRVSIRVLGILISVAVVFPPPVLSFVAQRSLSNAAAVAVNPAKRPQGHKAGPAPAVLFRSPYCLITAPS
jgi:hypothetical protein